MAILSMAELSLWDEARFRRSSRRLDEFLRGDFSSIAGYLADAFPNTDGMQERYVPLVQKFASELSGLYARPVVRTFTGVPEPAAAKLADVYKASRIDRRLEKAERFAWVQQTAVLVVLPDGPRRVRVLVAAPWQCKVQLGDPLAADDPTTWQRLSIAVPGQVVEDVGATIDGELELTPKTAWLRSGGTARGVYGVDGRNALGRIPVVVVRNVEPESGRPFAPVNEPLLNLHIALCLQESDTELLVHTQSWGQKVIENASHAQLVEELAVGPEKITALVRDGDPAAPSPTLRIVQGQPPIAQITSWQESRIRLACSMLGLNPDAFLKVNTALTASARLLSDQERRAKRDEIRPRFEDGEVELAQLVAETTNLGGLVQVPVEQLGVTTTWQDTAPVVDAVADVTAKDKRISLGLTSAARILSAEEGITLEEARERVRENREDSRAVEPKPAAPAPGAAPAGLPGAMPPGAVPPGAMPPGGDAGAGAAP